MTNKVLKIYPITEQISLGDIVSLLKNFKLEEVKIKKPIVMVRFRNFNKEIQQQIIKEFPNDKSQIQGNKINVMLVFESQIQGEVELNSKNSGVVKKLSSKDSIPRKHTVETNLIGEISDPSGLNFCLQNNVKWASQMIKNEPDYFTKLINIQRPKYLWIGCADSRVPANQIVGLKPGQLFVHRNVANIVSPSDINALAVIQYAIQHLQVQDVIVTGHYGCGGVKSSFSKTDYGLLEAWLSNLRQIRAKYHNILQLIEDQKQKVNKLVQLNVQSQVLNISRIPLIQRAWKNGKKLRLHGLVYRLQDGILHNLKCSMDSMGHIPEQYRIIE